MASSAKSLRIIHAELASLTWVFFKDVDLVGLGGARGFIVGVAPRRLLKPEALGEPSFIFP
ncbi:MAG: hypothetical protein QXN53_04205 [Thermoproteota archaeon]